MRGRVEAANDLEGARARKKHRCKRVVVHRTGRSAAEHIIPACLVVAVGAHDIIGCRRVGTSLGNVDAAEQHVGTRVEVQGVRADRAAVAGHDTVIGDAVLLGDL